MSISGIGKIYLVLLAFTNSISVLGILGINEPVFPNTLSFRPYNLVLVAIFLVLPILIIARDNYNLFLVLSGIYFIRVILESFAYFMWTSSFNLISILLYSFAILICLGIITNKLSLNIAGKILSLSWTQY